MDSRSLSWNPAARFGYAGQPPICSKIGTMKNDLAEMIPKTLLSSIAKTAFLALAALSLSQSVVAAEDHPELDPADVAYSEGNYEKAAGLYRKDAELGVIAAQISLAVMYMDGLGVPQDFSQAAKWYRQAADLGNGEAQLNLGLMYQDGKGVDKNPVEADKWFHLAGAKANADRLEKTLSPEQIGQAKQLADAWRNDRRKAKAH